MEVGKLEEGSWKLEVGRRALYRQHLAGDGY